ncbi:MAG: hypothetical protein ACO1N0_17655 [Fluviicola sp.]
MASGIVKKQRLNVPINAMIGLMKRDADILLYLFSNSLFLFIKIERRVNNTSIPYGMK